MSNFFNTKNHKNRLIFDNYSNDKKWTFLEHNVCRACVDFTNTDSMVHTTEECFIYTYKDGSVTRPTYFLLRTRLFALPSIGLLCQAISVSLVFEVYLYMPVIILQPDSLVTRTRVACDSVMTCHMLHCIVPTVTRRSRAFRWYLMVAQSSVLEWIKLMRTRQKDSAG